MTRRFLVFAALALTARLPLSAQSPSRDANPIRTADINVRGLKRTDFPRVYKLADNVYVYSGLQVRTDIEMEFATNNLFVVTPAGVLVADAQINEADTRRLLAEIAKVTPQPVKYVVVGSDHNDHTGGNTAFPAGTTFISTAASKAALEARNASSSTKLPIPSEIVSDKKVLNLGGTETTS